MGAAVRLDRGRDMRLFLRILGTWLVALALVLAIIDGTRSLAANALVLTPLSDTWLAIHPASLDALMQFIATRYFGPLLDGAIQGLLSLPGWAVLGVPGLIIAWLGRTRRARVFVKQDQF